jgi:hypothetical protein
VVPLVMTRKNGNTTSGKGEYECVNEAEKPRHSKCLPAHGDHVSARGALQGDGHVEKSRMVPTSYTREFVSKRK